MVLWWAMDSARWRSKGGKGDSSLRAISRKQVEVSPLAEVGNKPKSVSGVRSKEGVDASIETGSGKEIRGEKILQFKNDAGYRKFLKEAPAGVVLGQIEGLRAVRVQDGDWRKSMMSSMDTSVAPNYQVVVPEVPLEVKTMGDAFYRAVGPDALKLLGAEDVTADWGKGVMVALLDTSLNPTSSGLGSEEGHGTAMASLISGFGGVARGAAPGATLLEFPVLDAAGKGDSFTLAKAIYDSVDRGAKVINMSLGSEGDSSVVRDAVAYALSKQVALVAAAGNEAVNRVNYPAAYDGVVAVGSVDGDPVNTQHLYFSNRGAAVDVAAPGFAVVANWPGGKNVEVSGTSASTALVSGAIAALLSKERGLTGKQAAELIVRYANDTGMAGADEETGKGVVNVKGVLERNQRGIVDLATAGVMLDMKNGKVTVAVQNRGTETVNSPTIEITAGGATRKFYLGSLAPRQSMAESVQFDAVRAKQEGGIRIGANVEAPRGSDQRSGNDMWSGWYKISN